jgi:hypothetical protein
MTFVQSVLLREIFLLGDRDDQHTEYIFFLRASGNSRFLAYLSSVYVPETAPLRLIVGLLKKSVPREAF